MLLKGNYLSGSFSDMSKYTNFETLFHLDDYLLSASIINLTTIIHIISIINIIRMPTYQSFQSCCKLNARYLPIKSALILITSEKNCQIYLSKLNSKIKDITKNNCAWGFKTVPKMNNAYEISLNDVKNSNFYEIHHHHIIFHCFYFKSIELAHHGRTPETS